MKIRNPIAAPIRETHINAADSCLEYERYKTEIAIPKATDVAKPSRPSVRLAQLVMPTRITRERK